MTIYFVFGPLDILIDDFTLHYKSKITEAAKEEDSMFVLGDARGTDTMSNLLLSTLVDNKTRVVVYHMFNKPRNNPGNFPTHGGFKNDNSRDVEMSKRSHRDIGWVRSPDDAKSYYGDKYDPKRISGTQKNFIRREKLNQIVPSNSK